MEKAVETAVSAILEWLVITAFATESSATHTTIRHRDDAADSKTGI